MLTKLNIRVGHKLLILLALLSLFSAPALARDSAHARQVALSQFQKAERLREALNGMSARERTKADYQRVIDAYRRVYFKSPSSSKSDSSIMAVAELQAEMGRTFRDEKASRAAITQYEFLRHDYPGSKHRWDAMFSIAQIYKDDLNESEKAKELFQDFLRRYPRNRLAPDARDALAELEAPKTRKETREKQAAEKKAGLPLVTGIRSWSTPDYTRVAIDLEGEVKYEAGRVPDPDRIFFDLHDTRLAPALVGKTFDVADGFLRKVRVAQYQRGLTRIVLEVDDVSDYSAFLLPNPYRLIIDIHGRQPQKLLAKTSPEAKAESKAEAKADKESAKARDEEIAEDTTVLVKDKPEVSKPATSKTKPQVDTEGKFDAPVIAEKPAPKSAKTGAKKSARVETKVVEADDDEDSGDSTRTEVARVDDSAAKKSTAKPTTEPTFASVAPRKTPERETGKSGRKQTAAEARAARPTANGERSLIRALGLKIGKIVVDAGHGGHDTGTIGPSGLQEKDLVLDVALRLGKLLEGKMGADVIYTRDDDTFIPLETRTAVANQNQADLFISIHANSSRDANARGVETYYLNFTSSTDALEVAARENAVSETSIHELQDLVKKIALKDKIEESREFATDVQHSLHGGLAAKSPTLRDRGVKKAPFIVLIGANMPSILAEISFVSNPMDEQKLQTPEYRQRIAESLYKGVARYVSGLSGVKVASRGKADQGQ